MPFPVRRTLRAAIVGAAAGPVALLILAAGALQGQSSLGARPAATPDELAHVHRLMREHDPRGARAGAVYAVRLSAADLAVLAGHAARAWGGAAATDLDTGRLRVRASLPVLAGLGHRWLNLDATLSDSPHGLPHIEALRAGHWPVPAPLARWLAHRLLAWAEGSTPGEPLHRMVQGVTIDRAGLTLRYRWRADAPGRVIERLLPAEQQARLRTYTELLAQVTAGGDGPIEFTTLVAEMATLARQRSPDDVTGVQENRAWLRALALFVNGRSLSGVLPAAADWPRPRVRPVVLHQRVDFPQHFIVSALLAAEAGGPFADALGLGKEVDDSRFGSGFSFTDIAANRAGRKFGAFAVTAPRRLQHALGGTDAVPALLPDLSGLSEYLPEVEFVARFGGVGAPAYNRVLADIDARLAALALYR